LVLIPERPQSSCSQPVKEAKGLFQKAFVFNGNLGTVYDTPEAPETWQRLCWKKQELAAMNELMRWIRKTERCLTKTLERTVQALPVTEH
jgi:hypothetical protein